MRLKPLNVLLMNTNNASLVVKECLKHSDRLKRIISKNMFNTRQKHMEESSETSKHLDKIRKADRVDANNERISNAFYSRITSRRSAQ